MANNAIQWIMLATGITMLTLLLDRAPKLGSILLTLVVLGLLLTAHKKGIV